MNEGVPNPPCSTPPNSIPPCSYRNPPCSRPNPPPSSAHPRSTPTVLNPNPSSSSPKPSSSPQIHHTHPQPKSTMLTSESTLYPPIEHLNPLCSSRNPFFFPKPNRLKSLAAWRHTTHGSCHSAPASLSTIRTANWTSRLMSPATHSSLHAVLVDVGETGTSCYARVFCTERFEQICYVHIPDEYTYTCVALVYVNIS